MTGSATLNNEGRIEATSSTANNAYGLYISNAGNNFSNSGNILAKGMNCVGIEIASTDATATYINLQGGYIQAVGSTYVYGVDLRDGTFINQGTIVASGTSSVSAIALIGGQLVNTGTIAAGTVGQAIHAESGSSVTLGTGTRIMTVTSVDPDNPANNVYSAGGQVLGSSANLILDGTGTVDFDITGSWATVKKTGAGTWTVGKSITASTMGAVSVNEGTLTFAKDVEAKMSSLTLASGATLGLAAHNQTTAGVTVTGTAALHGTVMVDPGTSTVGDSTILSAGTLNTTGMTLASANPDFKVDLNSEAGGKLVMTTTYSPQTDGRSQSLLTTVADVQSFADVAQSRTLSLLDPMTTDLSADSGEREPFMVADNSGSLAGLFTPHEAEPQWRVFLQPVTSFGSRDADGTSSGYDSDMTGVEIGIDRKLSDHWLLGGFVGYGRSKIDFDDRTAGRDDYEDQELTTFGLYSGYRSGNWLIGDTLSATYADHSSHRYAGLSETATADYDSWVVRNQLLAVYDHDMGEGWHLTPRAGLNLTHVHREGFAESGATNAVSYDDLDKTFADLVAGVRTSWTYKVGGGTIAPYAGLGLTQSILDGDVTVRQYLSTTSAEVTTENDDTRLNPELGVVLARDRASLTLGDSGEYAETSRNSTFSAMLRWAF